MKQSSLPEFKIFGNTIPSNIVKKAIKQKISYQLKFGDDSNLDYFFKVEKNPVLSEFFNLHNLVLSQENNFNENQKYVIIGNIRMGYGHYRIAFALASYANALGYIPLWLDFNSYPQSTATKIITHLNNLYSLGSRLSQKYKLFDKLYWEPLNSKGFKKLSYNVKDIFMTELFVPLIKNIPKDIPFIGTHAWTSQAAVHAGFKKVINIVPDNWPMALHLAPGAIHAVQGPFSYFGYYTLNDFDKKILLPIPSDQIALTGHFIDYELVVNVEEDYYRRLQRLKNNKPLRILFSVGGAGAQTSFITTILKELLPLVNENKIALLINLGDHKFWIDEIKKTLENFDYQTHFDNWQETKNFAETIIDNDCSGVHVFYSQNIFEAVYTTNLFIRSADILVTKPSELAFYPVPKVFIRRVGGHEAWGAIRSAEIGDGSYECDDISKAINFIKLCINKKDFLYLMNNQILQNTKIGIYDGAKKAVELINGI